MGSIQEQTNPCNVIYTALFWHVLLFLFAHKFCSILQTFFQLFLLVLVFLCMCSAKLTCFLHFYPLLQHSNSMGLIPARLFILQASQEVFKIYSCLKVKNLL